MREMNIFSLQDDWWVGLQSADYYALPLFKPSSTNMIFQQLTAGDLGASNTGEADTW